jgi:hypothetical protein
MIAVLHPPNLDRSIIPAAGEEATARAGSQRLHEFF